MAKRFALLDSLRTALALDKFCLGVDVQGEASTLELKYYQLHAKLYILIRYKNRYFSSVFKKDGTQIMDHFRTDDIMTLIHCSRDYEESSSLYTLENIDEWIKIALNLWALKYSFEASEVHSDCSMVLYRSE